MHDTMFVISVIQERGGGVLTQRRRLRVPCPAQRLSDYRKNKRERVTTKE